MKRTADLLIHGNLLVANTINGGGIFCLSEKEEIDEYFDTSDAIVIHGDLNVDSFDAGGRTVVVCGQIAQEGGCDEQ